MINASETPHPPNAGNLTWLGTALDDAGLDAVAKVAVPIATFYNTLVSRDVPVVQAGEMTVLFMEATLLGRPQSSGRDNGQ